MNVVKIGLVVMLMATVACNRGNSQNVLTAQQFEAKLNSKPDAQLLDVRTPEEYKDGHLANAQNINIDGEAFSTEVGKLDKNKPVFVYCLAGGRSANASAQLAKMGFKEVYDLKGGYRAWLAEGKPVNAEDNKGKKPKSTVGITKTDLDKLLADKPFTVVDFSAKWCGPCKKLSPELDKIAEKMGAKLNVIKIDVDENPLVADAYTVESLPTLFFFNNTKLLGKSLGYSGPEKLQSDIESYSKLAGVAN